MKSGSLMEVATHFVIFPLPIYIDPIDSTTMLSNDFMASIPNSRSNPSGLACTTGTLILAETPFSVDTVTTPTPQHGQDMPPIVMTSTVALFQDWHRSASTIVGEKPVSISAEHCVPSTYMIVPGSAAFTFWWGRRLALMPCPCLVSRTVPDPMSNLTASVAMCPLHL